MAAADLLLRIRADAKQALSELDRAADAQQKASTVGKAAVLAMGAAAIAAGKQLWDAGVQAEAFGRRYETVFEGATAALDDWVSSQASRFGESEAGMKGLAASVGDLLVPMGMTRQQAALMTQDVLNTSNALSEWTGGQRDATEVSQILVRAMLGERDALIGLGVKISEEEVQAELAARGMKNLAGAEMQRAKALITMELIQGRSNDALRAYESGTGGAIAAQREMEAALKQVRDALGQMITNLAPAIEALAKALGMVGGLLDTKDINAFRDDIADALGRVLRGSAEEAAAALEWLSENTTLTVEAAEVLGTRLEDVRRIVGELDETVAKAVGPISDLFRTVDDSVPAVVTLTHSEEGLIATTDGSAQAAATWALQQRIARDAAGELAARTDAAAEATRNLAQAQLENTSKVAAAVGAVQRYEEAAQKAATATGDELAQAQLDLAIAALEAQANLDALRYDPAALANAMAAIEDATGLADDEVRALLESLGILQGTTVRGVVSFGSNPRIERRQHGGPVYPGRPYIVGEDGPELMYLAGNSGFVSSSKGFVSAAKAAAMPLSAPIVNAPTTLVAPQIIVQGQVWALDDLAAEVEARLVRAAARGGTSLVLGGAY